MQRIGEIMREKPAIVTGEHPAALPPAPGARSVRFEHVWFSKETRIGCGYVSEKKATGGFSPRKPGLVVYLAPYLDDKGLKSKLGKHRAGAGCLYIKRLEDIDLGVLKRLAEASIAELRRRYG